MRGWFESIAGPEYGGVLMWVVAILIIAVLLFLFFRILKSLSSGTFIAGGRNRKTRLAVMDATAIDNHRRLVLVRRDDIEHLILIGGPTDVVVEQNIRLADRGTRPSLAHDGPEDIFVAPPVREPQAPPAARPPEDLPRPVAQPVPQRTTPPVPQPALSQHTTPPPPRSAPPPAPQRTAPPAQRPVAVAAPQRTAPPVQHPGPPPRLRPEVPLGPASERSPPPVAVRQPAAPDERVARAATTPPAPVSRVAVSAAAFSVPPPSPPRPAAQASSGTGNGENALDAALLRELETQLDDEEPRGETREQDQKALEDEMMKLLGDLSEKRR